MRRIKVTTALSLVFAFLVFGVFIFPTVKRAADLRAGGYCTKVKRRLTDIEHVNSAIKEMVSAKSSLISFDSSQSESVEQNFEQELASYVLNNPTCCIVERPRLHELNSDSYSVFVGPYENYLLRAVTSSVRVMVVVRYPARYAFGQQNARGVYVSKLLQDECGGPIKSSGAFTRAVSDEKK